MASTTRGAIFERTTGFFEEALVWVVSVRLMGYLATSGIGMLACGAFNIIGGATQANGVVMQQGDGGSTGSMDQIESRLRDPMTAQKGFARLYERSKSSGAWQHKAEEMKPDATMAAWVSFGALVPSLLAPVVGAMVWRRRLPVAPVANP